MWGTSRLRNAGGTWVKRWTGGIADGDARHVYGTFKGTGGYAGLVAHESGWFVEAGQGFAPDIQVVGAGRIETTDGSPVPPAPGPGTTPASWTPVVGIATLKNAAYSGPAPFVLDVVQSDPRLNGRLEASFEEIGTARRDGSIDYRVRQHLEQPGRHLAAHHLHRRDGARPWTGLRALPVPARRRAPAPTRGSRITPSRTTRNPSPTSPETPSSSPAGSRRSSQEESPSIHASTVVSLAVASVLLALALAACGSAAKAPCDGPALVGSRCSPR